MNTPLDIPEGLLPEAVDLRRAAALIKHCNPDMMNLDGLDAIVSEVKSDLRITQALAAVAVIAYQVPGWCETRQPPGAIRPGCPNLPLLPDGSQRKGHRR